MAFTLEHVLDRLRNLQNGRSLRALAARLGVSEQYLSDVLRGNRTPGPKILHPLGLRKLAPQVTRLFEPIPRRARKN